MRRRTWITAGAAWLASAAACGAPAPARLRIGLTAVMLADQAAFLARWSAYLADRLQIDVSFITRDEYQPLHDLLGAGRIDALWTCGYPYVRFQSRLQLLAVPVYHGQPTYQSYLIRPAGVGSQVRGYADLRDKVFAYSDPLSNSGWLVAQGEFQAVGLVPSRDLKRTFFAHGHRNVAEAVAAELADAGSIDGYVWETMRLQGMTAALRSEVVWKSRLHGFPPVVTRAGDERPELAALQATLVSMQADAEGRALLASLNLDGFIVGQPSIFDSIHALALRVPDSGVSA
jgi:phosphonate transport system substrate-binding protein